MAPKLTNAEKIALALAKMRAYGIEPITTRKWKPAIAHVAPAQRPHEAVGVTTLRRRSK